MSTAPSSPATTVSLWQNGTLLPREDCDVAPATIRVADSWLVEDGTVRGLELHRDRFLSGVGPERATLLDAPRFWEAALAAIPREGAWFPRVELRTQRDAPQLLFRLREAPPRRRSLVLTTHQGSDPRREPTVKGPDLAAMIRMRSEAQAQGADEAVVLSPEGHLVEGSTSSIVWWSGGTLCLPDEALSRVDGVTVRSVHALALALGIPVERQRVTPEELDGHEVWALNALHGIRIATAWTGGPEQLAEEPGRRERWSLRLDALRRSLPE